jgi:hypothetical protein
MELSFYGIIFLWNYLFMELPFYDQPFYEQTMYD